ncbi:MAG: hypothetical protein RR265_08480, partial [Cetobacterium sp.]
MQQILENGGIILWILLGLSIISLGTIMERSYCFIKNKSQVNPKFKKNIQNLLLEKKYEDAVELSRTERGVVGKAITKFLIR